MAFFIKKSVIILLPILLLINSCHANGHLPHVRKEYRKLLGRFPTNAFRKQTSPYFKQTLTNGNGGDNSLEHETVVSDPKLNGHLGLSNEDFNKLTKPATTYNNPKYTKLPIPPNEHGSLKKALDQLAHLLNPEAFIKKTGEDIAEKLFGANGKRGFKVGWKVGKWVYKMDKKCEKYEEALNITCQSSTIPGENCVILVNALTGSPETSCSDQDVPKEESIPCTYINGNVSIGRSIYQYPDETCFTNMIEP